MRIKNGTKIREYGYGAYIDSTVITEPVKNERGQLEFKSQTSDGRVIDYMKRESSLEILTK